MFYGPNSAIDIIRDIKHRESTQWPPKLQKEKDIAEIDEALSELFDKDGDNFWS